MPATRYDALARNLVGYILSPTVIASQLDKLVGGMVIDGESEIAPFTKEKHTVTLATSHVTSKELGVLSVTLPLSIRLVIELPLNTDVYEFDVKVALTLTAEQTGPMTIFLANAPVTAQDVTITHDEMLAGLLNLEFFISGALKDKVAEEVNRMLDSKVPDRTIDLQARVAQALGMPAPGNVPPPVEDGDT